VTGFQHRSRIPSKSGPDDGQGLFYGSTNSAHRYDERPGCQNSYTVNGFQIFYCSSHTSAFDYEYDFANSYTGVLGRRHAGRLRDHRHRPPGRLPDRWDQRLLDRPTSTCPVCRAAASSSRPMATGTYKRPVDGRPIRLGLQGPSPFLTAGGLDRPDHRPATSRGPVALSPAPSPPCTGNGRHDLGQPDRPHRVSAPACLPSTPSVTAALRRPSVGAPGLLLLRWNDDSLRLLPEALRRSELARRRTR